MYASAAPPPQIPRSFRLAAVLAIVLTFAAAAAAVGEEPALTGSVGEPLPAYKLGDLGVSGLADSASVLWRFEPPTGLDVRHGGDRQAVFTGAPGRYEVRATWVDFDARKMGEVAGTIEIAGGAPTPPKPGPQPQPGPQPAPGPIETDGDPRAAELTATAARELHAGYAAAYRTLAAEVESGAITTKAAFAERVRALTVDALGRASLPVDVYADDLMPPGPWEMEARRAVVGFCVGAADGHAAAR